MSLSIPATVIRASLLAAVLGIWFGLARASSNTEHTTLTVEDLVEAYERGDLSFEELEEVLAILESGEKRDRNLVSAAQDAVAIWVPASGARSYSRSGRRHGFIFQHQVYGSLRGNLKPRQSIRLTAGRSRPGIRIDLGRNGVGSWHARRATAHWQSRHVSISAGSLQPVWTGGLLIGHAPRFMASPSDFIGSLLQPKLARLTGAEVQMNSGKTQVEVLYSSRSDSLLSHRAVGLRLNLTSGALTLTPAIIQQQIVDLRHTGRFSAHYGGLSAVYRGEKEVFRSDIALSAEGVALQSEWTGSERDRVSWRFELWHIPESFRNPLMHAQAQSDRELVKYPEIERELSSTSTGERGGELGLVLGPPNARTELRGTWWRENSHRQASLRASIVFQRPFINGHIKFGYSIRHRPELLGVATKQRIQIRLQGKHLWSLVSAHVTEQAGLRPRMKGGQLRCGYKSREQGLGTISLSASIDVSDLRGDGFVTIRYSQLLRQSSGQTLSMYLRWRSAYNTSPVLLSLRVKTEISI